MPASAPIPSSFESLLLAFFFELAIDHRAEPRRGTERFAIVVERQIRHVQRIDAARRVHVDDDGDGLPCVVPSRNASRQPQARRACSKPFSMG